MPLPPLPVEGPYSLVGEIGRGLLLPQAGMLEGAEDLRCSIFLGEGGREGSEKERIVDGRKAVVGRERVGLRRTLKLLEPGIPVLSSVGATDIRTGTTVSSDLGEMPGLHMSVEVVREGAEGRSS